MKTSACRDGNLKKQKLDGNDTITLYGVKVMYNTIQP